ncbi:MAG TPA: twin-arginine translocase TatA/TatE family subunit [Caldisericia bacterium]|nr:twin-arginine translocase TatA/TatE family subunit [Caldisericia bacterium]HPF49000.1 twin-arginine translocase TatA/TatE family subunit [Caldisericia bacterium]HPI83136.1 twin-arginine translocase TatA/TatE family subunit [Caldisericia bacterium]HPQ92363.1 twin-arginine translocase TatA/TatE family subunit [Caldisericia bacterium]HRV74539.1 twin-arginine translocase TatA/TatE family subunit [Caldisericia bacterium]
MSFGAREIIIILVIALVLFGSNKIPEFARSLRKGINEFKKVGDDIAEDIGDKSDK